MMREMTPVTYLFFVLLISPPFLQAHTQVQGALLGVGEFYKTTPSPQQNENNTHILVQMHLNHQWNQKNRLQFQSEFRKSTTPLLQAKEEPHFEAQEAFWEYQAHSTLRFQLGQNIYNWGALDGYSPADALQPLDYGDPLKVKKRGSLGLHGQWESSTYILEMLWVPQSTLSLLPNEKSRWWPQNLLLNYNTEFGEIQLPENLNYSYKATTILDQADQNNYGLRIQKRFSTLDVALYYYNGLSPTPQIRPELTIILTDPITTDPHIQLQPLFYRQQTSALSFVFWKDEWIGRWEGVYKDILSSSDGLDPWSFEQGLAVERSFSIWGQSFTTLLQYYHANYPTRAQNFPISHFRLFENTAVLAQRWNISERSFLLYSLLHQLSSQNYLHHIQYSTPLILESLKLNIDIDSIQAAENSLLGTFNSNDRVLISLEKYF